MALKTLLFYNFAFGCALAAPKYPAPGETILQRGESSSTTSQISFVFAPLPTDPTLSSVVSSSHATSQSTSSLVGVLPPIPIPIPSAKPTPSPPPPPPANSPKPSPTPPQPIPLPKPPKPAPPSIPKPPSMPKPPSPPAPPKPASPSIPKPPKPSPPPGVKPPESQPSTTERSTEKSCTTTITPKITISISYPLDSLGVFHTTTETITPSGIETDCRAPATTTTTTADFKLPQVESYTGSNPAAAPPSPYPTVDPRAQQYLGELFERLGYDDKQFSTSTSSAAHATSTCDGKTYAEAIPSAAAFVQGLLPNFCSDWSAKPGDTMSKAYTAKDVKVKSRRDLSLSRRTPPPAPLTPSSYPGWSVDFEWRADHATGDCLKKDYCNNALTTLLSQCKGYSLADAYSGGQTTDECGTFRYTIKGFPAIKSADTTCDLPTVNDPGSKNTPYKYQQKAFEAAAYTFCRLRKSEMTADPSGPPISTFYWENTAAVDPLTKLPSICYPDGESSISYSVGNNWALCKEHPPSISGRYDSDSSIALQIVPSPSQKGCKALGKHKIPTGDECYDNFMKVVNQCMPDDGGGKNGVWKENSEDGCWDWWMWGRELYQ